VRLGGGDKEGEVGEEGEEDDEKTADERAACDHIYII